MATAAPIKGIRLWPRTLRARLFIILLAGLAMAHAMSFAVLFSERYVAARSVMFNTLETDVATSIAILDRLPLPNVPPGSIDLLAALTGSFWGRGSPAILYSLRPTPGRLKIQAAIGAKYPIEVQSIPEQPAIFRRIFA